MSGQRTILFLFACLGGCGGNNVQNAEMSVPMDLAVDMPADLASTDLATVTHGPIDMAASDFAGCGTNQFCPNPRACSCSEPVAHSACPTGGLTCNYENCSFQCICFATEMKWYCFESGMASCPVAAPKDGSFCQDGTLSCSYACDGENTVQCECHNDDHAWHCKTTSCARDGGTRG